MRARVPFWPRPAGPAGWALFLLVAVSAGGCKSRSSKHAPGSAAAGVGVRIASGTSSDLRVSADGSFAAYLVDAEKPRLEGVPSQMVLGELHVVPTSGGSARKLANGVTNVPGGFLFSPDSRWLFLLEGYNAASQSGTLHALDLADPSGEPRRLGDNVSYMLASPDSKQLAFVGDGVLRVGSLDGGAMKEVAAEVTTAQFSPDSRLLYFKRRHSAAGGLAVVKLDKGGPPQKLGDQVGDYAPSPDSKRVAFAQRSTALPGTYELWAAAEPDFRPVKVDAGTSSFAFSPDGKWLVRTVGATLQAGADSLNLVGDLYAGPAEGAGGHKLGERVSEFAISPDSKAVGFLAQYSLEMRVGRMNVAALPDGKPRQLGLKVKTFTWSPSGTHLAFQPVQVSREFGPSADLMLYRTGDEAAVQVQSGVWGYGFGPKGEYLLARAGCTRKGPSGPPRSCDLMMRDLRTEGAATTKLAEGIFSFKASEDGQRVMVTYAEIGPDWYDVAVQNLKTNERKTLERHTLLPAYFLDGDGSRVAYAVAPRERAGIYVASQVP
ncbi:MAG: PD40 domain-containing protein [Myxococcales bacterium]|nr:PD40 domain-containing protein [Myxococcales bacterium]